MRSAGVFERDDIVVLADDVWDAPKRARHKMAMAWAAVGNRVLWVETPYPSARSRRPIGLLDQVRPRLFVTSPPSILRTHYARSRPWSNLREPAGRLALGAIVRRAVRALELDVRWTVVWQEPRLASAIGIPGRHRLYYASDILEDPGARRALVKCAKWADLVFATSDKIASDLRPFHARVHAIAHAVDLEWWQSADRSEPPLLAPIPQPRLLFSGVGTVKFDLTGWLRLAVARPDLQLVTVGPFDPRLEASETYAAARRLPNVHLLGEQPFASLPGFLQHADVLVCPYRADAVRTASGLPNKFYEYALTGAPILSTPFTEFEAFLPQLTVQPLSAWKNVAVEALPRAANPLALVADHTYASRVAEQRAILAPLVAGDGS